MVLLFLLPSGETSPGVVGSSIEQLELDGHVTSRTANRRVEDMARNGTTGSHGVSEKMRNEVKGVMEKWKKRKKRLFKQSWSFCATRN